MGGENRLLRANKGSTDIQSERGERRLFPPVHSLAGGEGGSHGLLVDL